MKLDRQTFRQFLLFAAVGAVSTAAHFAVLIALVQLANMPAPWATTAGFVVGALVNYLLNYRITFASNARHVDAMPKFFTIAACGAAINFAIMWSLTAYHLHYLLAQIVATGVVLVVNYIANRLWTFRAQRPA